MRDVHVTALRRAFWLGALAVVAGLSTAVPARAGEPVRAVWNVQEIDFPYFGHTTYYSCDGLRDRMRHILTQLGVREDYVLTIGGCVNTTGPERSLSVRLIVANAVVADDATMKKIAADNKRGDLLAKMSKKAKTPFSDEPFDAVAKQVVLTPKDRNNFSSAAGDCELLEQVRRSLLPVLGAKILKNEVSCTPHQGVVGNPRMEVEMLVAASANGK